jgi:hypothetical protein
MLEMVLGTTAFATLRGLLRGLRITHIVRGRGGVRHRGMAYEVMRLVQWWVCLDICVGGMTGASMLKRLRRAWLQLVVARGQASVGVMEDMM